MQIEFKKRVPLKRQQLSGLLLAQITGGKYPVGSMLPPVKQLAELLKASYVTVIKSIKDLEHAGIIECRHGVGNYVKASSGTLSSSQKLLCILHSGVRGKLKPNHQLGIYEQLTSKCIEKFEAAGWSIRFFPSLMATERQVKAYTSIKNMYFLFMSMHPYEKTIASILKSAGDRSFAVGEVYEGIPCVTSDENQVMHLLMDHMRENGRRKVGLLCANLDSLLERERAAVWRSICYYNGLDMAWTRENLFNMALPECGEVAPCVTQVYNTLKSEGKLRELEGIIVPDGEIAARLMGHLLDDGFKIPDDIAIASTYMDKLSTIFRPQITSVDIDMKAHAQIALEVLSSIADGNTEPPMHYVCQPQLRIRGSSTHIDNK